MSDEKTTDKPAVRLFEGQLAPAETARSVWIITAPPGATPEDFLEAETYAHVLGRKIKAGAKLEITAEDKTWYAEVLIRDVAGQIVHAAMLCKHNFSPLVGKEHDAYEEKWGGPQGGWRVIRKSDRSVMIDKLQLKSQATAWIEENAGKTPEPLKKAA